MSQRLKRGTRTSQGARQITSLLQEQFAQIQLGDEEDIEELDEDFIDEIDDHANSEAILTGESVEHSFDLEWSSALPLEKQLARRTSPPVRYLIDSSLNVHRLDSRDDSGSNLSHLIASAVARHIRDSRTDLVKPGDWRHIPAIESERKLLKLVVAGTLSSGTSYELLKMRFEKVGASAKSFAILLPNGDVVTPQALIDDATTGRRATRAGALRQKTLQESGEEGNELAGENWTPAHWKALKHSETTARSRVRKA